MVYLYYSQQSGFFKIKYWVFYSSRKNKLDYRNENLIFLPGELLFIAMALVIKYLIQDWIVCGAFPCNLLLPDL